VLTTEAYADPTRLVTRYSLRDGEFRIRSRIGILVCR